MTEQEQKWQAEFEGYFTCGGTLRVNMKKLNDECYIDALVTSAWDAWHTAKRRDAARISELEALLEVKLPVPVTFGSGTIHAGVDVKTLALRAKAYYEHGGKPIKAESIKQFQELVNGFSSLIAARGGDNPDRAGGQS